MMFWLPILISFTRSEIYDTYTLDSYSYDGGSYDYYDTATLKSLSPAEERPLLEAIADELRRRSNAELFQLRAYNDVCAIDLLDCRGLDNVKIKPFIDSILADRQTAVTANDARIANYIAGAGLFISFIALIFTGLTYRRRRAGRESAKHGAASVL
jgi:hypothetical protein